MARTVRSAKQAGSSFETLVAKYLAEVLADDRIERRAKNGAKDRGDITGVRTITGARVVVECKNYAGKYHITDWLRQATVEAGNDDAQLGVVVAKKRGTAKPAEQVVFMTLQDLACLLGASIEREY